MVADFFTKPLQGSQFIKLRDVVLGYKHISSLEEANGDIPNEERVRFSQDSGSGNKSIGALNEGQTVGDEEHVDKKNVTWADIVARNPIEEKENVDPLILLKQSQH